jgi:O-antigen/teichoic acid export membrane protein
MEPAQDPKAPPAKSRLLQDSSVYLAANIFGRAVGFVMIPFYASNLSTDEYGVLNLMELSTSVVAIMFGLQSMGQALTRIYHDQTTQAARDCTVSTALIALVAMSGVTACIAALAAPWIADLVSLHGQAALLRLAFGSMFFSSIAEVVLVYQRMRNRVWFYAAYTCITLVFTLTLNVLLIGWFRLGVYGFAISKLAVSAPACLYLLVQIWREVGAAWRAPIARALARFAGPLIVSSLCYFAVHFSDLLFLAPVSRAQAGVYSLAYNFAFLLSILVGDSFSKSWSVSFYGLASGEGWQARFVQVGRWLVFVLGAGSVGISLFGRDVLVMMVPESYDPPEFLLPVLVFAYFLRELGDFFNSMLLIGSGSGLVGRIAVAGAALNLVLNAWLIPRFGIWGAACATFGTWAGYCAVCWIGAWRARRVAMAPWPLCFILLLSALCLMGRAALPLAGPVGRLAEDGAAFALFLTCAFTLYLRRGERAEAFDLARRGMALVGLT